MALDLAAMQDKFTLPQEEAARELGISLTSLKQVCRKLGLKRWPYRPASVRARKKQFSRPSPLPAQSHDANEDDPDMTDADEDTHVSSSTSSETPCQASTCLPVIQTSAMHGMESQTPRASRGPAALFVAGSMRGMLTAGFNAFSNPGGASRICAARGSELISTTSDGTATVLQRNQILGPDRKEHCKSTGHDEQSPAFKQESTSLLGLSKSCHGMPRFLPPLSLVLEPATIGMNQEAGLPPSIQGFLAESLWAESQRAAIVGEMFAK